MKNRGYKRILILGIVALVVCLTIGCPRGGEKKSD